MKNKRLQGVLMYAAIILSIGAACFFLLFLLGESTTVITKKLNDYYMPHYVEKEKGITSPWYQNGLHVVDEGFIDEMQKMKENKNHIVVIGSSLSVISMRREYVALEDGFAYTFFVCGNGSWRSDRIMDSLIRKSNGYGPEDIVKFEMSFSTFRDMEHSITETALEKWGKYSVNEDLTVRENPVVGAPVYWMNLQLLKFQNLYELGQSYVSLFGKTDFMAVGNYRNSYTDYENTAKLSNMTEDMITSVETQLSELNEDTRLVVELSYMPQGLAETEFGKTYDRYIEERFIPFLEKNGISYVDYRNDYDDEEYADGVHLSYDASVRYTKKLNNDMNALIRGGIKE